MVAALNSQSREELRAKAQGLFGRRLLTPRDFETESGLDQLPRGLRQGAMAVYQWAKDEMSLVVPVTEEAFKREAIYFSMASAEDPQDVRAIATELHHQAEIFDVLDPKSEPSVFSKVLVVIFPKLNREVSNSIIDLKREFAAQGLLLEEFGSHHGGEATTVVLRLMTPSRI